MKLSDNLENTAAAQEHKHPIDFMADFEGVQICFDRVANLCQLYREMLDDDWNTEKSPAPYIMELYWKRRELYFSQFEAIELLFLDALKDMKEIVKKGYEYCWSMKEQRGDQDGK